MFLSIEGRQEMWLFSKYQHKLIRVKPGVRVRYTEGSNSIAW